MVKADAVQGESSMRMSKIVRTIADVMFPFAMVFGIYVILHGHLTPGGGFQGGAATASALAMLLVAYGSIDILHRISEHKLTILECAGALIFAGTAAIGLFRTFFYNFLANTGSLFGTYPGYGPNGGDLNTGGVLPIMNIGVGLCVIAGLFAILVIMAYATTVKEPEEKGNGDETKGGH
ncbi:MAG: MnhB domain-containing protein [Candidatus Thermoplasmatota archaeon]|nr:MnhB domain-containing protein [Candidatus Thermoplasmatota archaeon]